jgi:hypothetical protein
MYRQLKRGKRMGITHIICTGNHICSDYNLTMFNVSVLAYPGLHTGGRSI